MPHHPSTTPPPLYFSNAIGPVTLQGFDHVPWFNLLPRSGGLGAIFASKSRNLQHLAISPMINAEETLSTLSVDVELATSAIISGAHVAAPAGRCGKARASRFEALLYAEPGVLVQRVICPRYTHLCFRNGRNGHAPRRSYATWTETTPRSLGAERGIYSQVFLRSSRRNSLPRSCLFFPNSQLKQGCVRGVIGSHGGAVIYNLK